MGKLYEYEGQNFEVSKKNDWNMTVSRGRCRVNIHADSLSNKYVLRDSNDMTILEEVDNPNAALEIACKKIQELEIREKQYFEMGVKMKRNMEEQSRQLSNLYESLDDELTD